MQRFYSSEFQVGCTKNKACHRDFVCRAKNHFRGVENGATVGTKWNIAHSAVRKPSYADEVPSGSIICLSYKCNPPAPRNKWSLRG